MPWKIPAADTAIGIAGYQGTAIWINSHAASGDIAFALKPTQALTGGVVQAGNPGFRQADPPHGGGLNGRCLLMNHP